MTKYANKFRVESSRLKIWDYTIPWWYYVTINTKDHSDWFGEISNGNLLLNENGLIVKEEWLKTKMIRTNVDLDEYVIMPNHFHGIIILIGESERRDVARYVSTSENMFSMNSPKPGSLSAIVRSFKSSVTKRLHLAGHDEFSWQSRFYDRIIRNQKELDQIRKYIYQNPFRWDIEKNIPENIFM